MSEPGSAPGFLRHGPDFRPATVHHATRDLSWQVWEVLGHWQYPAPAPVRVTLDEVVECWRLRVRDPLPGKPGCSGEFVMVARTYGDRPGWELVPNGLVGPVLDVDGAHQLAEGLRPDHGLRDLVPADEFAELA